MFRLNVFRTKIKDKLSHPQEVPEGTFRCDVCRFVQPLGGICGTVKDQADSTPRVYTLCGSCALWLGLGTSRFQPDLFYTFSHKQLSKIHSLHQEFDSLGSFDGISKKISELAAEGTVNIRGADNPDQSFEKAHKSLESVPNLRSLTKFRFSILPNSYRDISDRLTRGEPVDKRDIKRTNR